MTTSNARILITIFTHVPGCFQTQICECFDCSCNLKTNMNQNSVEYLQAINISQPNLVGKSDIKYIRRATPGLIISQSSSRVQTYVKKK